MLGWLYELADAARDRARRREWDPDLARGRRAEDLAHRYLRRQGYTIVARNWRTDTGGGELDLVALDGSTLVFVEVKSRAGDQFGPPDRAVDGAKRERLMRAARQYARRADADFGKARFDVVSVVFSQPVRIELLRDAFSNAR